MTTAEAKVPEPTRALTDVSEVAAGERRLESCLDAARDLRAQAHLVEKGRWRLCPATQLSHAGQDKSVLHTADAHETQSSLVADLLRRPCSVVRQAPVLEPDQVDERPLKALSGVQRGDLYSTALSRGPAADLPRASSDRRCQR